MHVVLLDLCALARQCLIFLDDPQAVAEILEKLLKCDSAVTALMAYQIGFDLYESATQQFLKRIQDALRNTAPIPIPGASADKTMDTTTVTPSVKTTVTSADSEATDSTTR